MNKRPVTEKPVFSLRSFIYDHQWFALVRPFYVTNLLNRQSTEWLLNLKYFVQHFRSSIERNMFQKEVVILIIMRRSKWMSHANESRRAAPLGRCIMMPLIMHFKLNARLSRDTDSRSAGANVARINHAPRVTTPSPVSQLRFLAIYICKGHTLSPQRCRRPIAARRIYISFTYSAATRPAPPRRSISRLGLYFLTR